MSMPVPLKEQACTQVLQSSNVHLLGDFPESMTLAEACFWHSMSNVVTIGNGALVPATTAASLLTTLEHFIGILLSSLLLGLVVAKGGLLW